MVLHRHWETKPAASVENDVVDGAHSAASKILDIDVELPGVGEDGMPGRNEQ